MVVPGGLKFLISEVPLYGSWYRCFRFGLDWGSASERRGVNLKTFNDLYLIDRFRIRP
jgi:hypothetical protein